MRNHIESMMKSVQLALIVLVSMWGIGGLSSSALAEEPGKLARSMVGGLEITSEVMARRADTMKKARLRSHYRREMPTDELQSEVIWLAWNMYFEARGESRDGWRAVAHVTVNRVLSERYPDTVRDVVTQKNPRGCQFSWYCDGLQDSIKLDEKEMAIFLEMERLAHYILTEHGDYDPTNGALHYYNATKANPKWAWGKTPCAHIGSHIFLCGIS